MASIYKIPSGWRAQIRLTGKTPLSEVFKTKNEAKIWAREQEERLHKQKSGTLVYTFPELLKEYRANTRRFSESKESILRQLERHFADTKIRQFTQATFRDFAKRRRRTDGVAPSTVLQELSYLGVVLKHGGALLDSDDARRARDHLSAAMITLRHTGDVGDSVERDRRPTEGELRQLDDYFFARQRSIIPMCDIVMFAICTCLRLGEIVGPGGITWDDLKEDERTLVIRGRKDPKNPNGRTGEIPLLKGPVTFRGNTICPLDIILRQRTARHRLGRIFPFSEDGVSTSFSIACKTLHIPDLVFHDLRHDGISRLFEAGYGIPHVAVVSGHKSWKHLQRYTQIRPITLHRET